MRNLITGILLALVTADTAARAAQLQRLHILAFSLSADSRNPQVNQPFHVIVLVRVREQVTGVDNLVLPNLSQLEVSGDQQDTAATAAGTTYSESIAVVVHHAGPVLIAPAYIDAIDSRDGRAKRFLSNDLKLNVGAGPAAPEPNRAAVIARTLTGAIVQTIASIAFWVVAFTFVVGVAALVFMRPRAPVRPALPATAPQLAPVGDARTALRLAADALRANPSRAAAFRVRIAAWHLLGASAGETLSDVLQRPGARDAALRALLANAERATFTHDGDLPAANAELLLSVDRYLA